MEMAAFDNATYVNYREVGFGFGNGQHDSAISVHWSVLQPNIGFGSTMGLVISLCLSFSLGSGVDEGG